MNEENRGLVAEYRERVEILDDFILLSEVYLTRIGNVDAHLQETARKDIDALHGILCGYRGTFRKVLDELAQGNNARVFAQSVTLNPLTGVSETITPEEYETRLTTEYGIEDPEELQFILSRPEIVPCSVLEARARIYGLKNKD